jgi:hypothetical protein
MKQLLIILTIVGFVFAQDGEEPDAKEFEKMLETCKQCEEDDIEDIEFVKEMFEFDDSEENGQFDFPEEMLEKCKHCECCECESEENGQFEFTEEMNKMIEAAEAKHKEMMEKYGALPEDEKDGYFDDIIVLQQGEVKDMLDILGREMTPEEKSFIEGEIANIKDEFQDMEELKAMFGAETEEEEKKED